MRVALLSRSAHPLHAPGGMEKAVYHLARSLRGRGVEVHLVTRTPVSRAAFPGEVVAVPWGGGERSHGRVLDRVRRYPDFSRRVGAEAARLVRERGVAVVDAQGLTALGYGRLRRLDPALAAPLLMNPQGMEEHRTSGLKRAVLLPLRRLSRQAARLSDRVIATDEATRADVTRLLGVEPERVAVVPNGIDPGEIRAATPVDAARIAEQAVPALRDASPVLLAVGRLEPYKGFADVIAAVTALHAGGTLGARWRLVVVGDGPDRRRLAALAGRLGGHVVLAGRIDDEPTLHALYERADLFVHATRFEGSSLVTLEAMAHGLPVVATRAGGIPDKVEDGRTGRLVAPGDTGALAAAIADALSDPGRARAWGEAGRHRATTAFAWSTIVGGVLALYDELIGGRR